jgi:hypothetical protein
MFQFMKDNKMVTATIAIIIILIVALCTGFVAQQPVLSVGFMLVGFVFPVTAFYNEVRRPRSK